MCQPWKLLIVYAGLVSSAPTDGRLFSKGVASIRGGGGGLRMSMGSLGTKQLRSDSELQKGSREDPESSGEAKREKAEDKQRREALKAQSDSNQGDDAGSEKSEEGSVFKDLNWEFKGTTMHVIAICLGALIVCTCFVCCVFCICKSKTSEKTEEAPMAKSGQADVEYIALSDSLMRELVSRSIQRVGPAFAKGAALQDIGQRSFEALTGKAQALLMSELNSAAGSVCNTIDAEEAALAEMEGYNNKEAPTDAMCDMQCLLDMKRLEGAETATRRAMAEVKGVAVSDVPRVDVPPSGAIESPLWIRARAT